MITFSTTGHAAPQQVKPLPKAPARLSAKAVRQIPDPKVVPQPRFLKPSDSGGQFSETKLGMPLLKNIVLDQRDIWTSPKNLRFSDVDWILPLAGITTASFMADPSISKAVTGSPSRVSKSTTFSNYGIAAMAGGVGGMYLWGKFTHDDHKRETGLLSGEAAVDALAVTTGLKYAFGRQRPTDGPGGGFWHGGTSFPSDHAAVAWSAASVIAHEYPGPLTKLFAYGLASAVTASRVTGKDHFPTDVLVGSAIGWFIGRQIYREHHDPELGGSAVGPLLGDNYGEERVENREIGSPYVPLDSWIYPAIERLAALGYVQTDYLDLRPWTRVECAEMVEEAGDLLNQRDIKTSEATRIYQALAKEFAGDMQLMDGDRSNALRLESVYTRAMDITGPPLRDSDHFGQTLINDFGRPYGQGSNVISGFSGWASSGRFAVYVRGEYQHAPSGPAYSQQVRNLIAQTDRNPVQPAQPIPTVNQFNLLDTYAVVNLDNWELSFGKQSLWWGPAAGGAFMISDNAEPFLMFRARHTVATEMPSIFKHLGPMKMDFFFGRLTGNQFPPRPLIHGEHFSFKPTANFEFGVSTTSELGGVGRPLTLTAIINSFISLKSSDLYPANANPGKRTFGFDFSYKVPHLRNWLTLYDDALLPEANNTNFDTSPSPIYTPSRTAMRPGIYLAKVPGVPNLDFRFEAVYTDPPTLRSLGGQYIYFNDYYHNLYTNEGNIIGDWIGREGMGFQGWSTYWFSPRSSIQLGYRHAKVSGDFIPGGETVNDGSLRANVWLNRSLSISAYLQYEKWQAPILASGPQSLWIPTFEIAFWPHGWSK